MNTKIVILVSFLSLMLTSCISTYKITKEVIESQKVVVNEQEEIKVPEHIMTDVDFLPDNEYESVSPVGGNPIYYYRSDSLDIYGYNKWTEEYSKCTLILPEGYTDGKIVSAFSGAGSGELEMILSANKNGEEVYLSYFFLSDFENGYLFPAFINVVDKPNI